MTEATMFAERFTTWTVTSAGEQANLGFIDACGQNCSVTLPVTLLNALMMTIPRIVQAALAVRGEAVPWRMTQNLADWHQARGGADTLLLSLSAPDGFEVIFSLSPIEAESLAISLGQAGQLLADVIGATH